jgi:hypothetical protein
VTNHVALGAASGATQVLDLGQCTQTEVSDEQLEVSAEQHVLGLQVPVVHAETVAVAQR